MRCVRLLFASLLSAAVGLAADAIQVPVWSPDGAALSAQSLAAAVDGAPAEVLNVHSPTDDLMLLVVLDLTEDLAAVEQARAALLSRIGTLAPNQYVAVFSAQNGLRVLAEPTGDRTAAASAIRSQQVGGRAGLLETIERSAQIGSSIIQKSGVRLAVLYLTDSNVNNYREALDNPTINKRDGGDVSRRADSLVRERIARMTASLARTQAPVFISHLSYRNDALNVAYQTGLIALAAATGGTTTVARSVAEIPDAINATLDHILGHYSVTLAVAIPGKKVAVTLEDQAGGSLDYRSSFVLGGN
jgi:hypothetical protein